MALPFADARRVVVEQALRLRAAGGGRGESVPLDGALGRVLAEGVTIDRDQPPFHRSTRDGFAVRAADVPGRLRVIGEAPAGAPFAGSVAAGECVEIMTGAPLPAGADAVVMVEHTRRDGDAVVVERGAAAGENWVAAGSEARKGDPALPAGTRVDPAAVALLASVGCAGVRVQARPRVAIVPTGNELVEVGDTPKPAQIRNSNGHSLAAQVARAGGEARLLPIAPDDEGRLRAILEDALADCDVLVLSGGVSMGKYDLVERILGELGARTFFDAVAIRPGKPAVFGEVRGKLFFGLPGNPLSTTLTFELFARPAIEILGGAAEPRWRLISTLLLEPIELRPLPLTLFLPGRYEGEGGYAVVPIRSQGSGDLVALARADCWILVPPDTSHVHRAATVGTMPK